MRLSFMKPEYGFEQLRDEAKVKLYSVDYAAFGDDEGAELYVTRFGWPLLDRLHPSRWFENHHFSRHGERLTDGTGTVYRVPTVGDGHPVDLVVKFSRMAQQVPLHVQSTFPNGVDPVDMAGARFLNPFEEFGGLMDLRRGRYGPRHLRIRTKLPLAIYTPAQPIAEWKLGRSKSRFTQEAADVARSQEEGPGPQVELRRDRDYVLLYHWVTGLDAVKCFHQGLISESELHALTARVTSELFQKGFKVLDNKPMHFILRPRGDRDVMRRHGEPVYTLIDFELLVRTQLYSQWLSRNRGKRAG